MTEPALDTVAYYDRNAEAFARRTGSLDLSGLYDRFVAYLPPGGRILEAGLWGWTRCSRHGRPWLPGGCL